MKWITSDSHFFHRKISGYCNRPYLQPTMDQIMTYNWNRVVVKEYDTVYHLGDFALCGKELKRKLVESLNGNIILIMGNHDKGEQHNLDCGFKEVHEFLLLNDNKLILSHKPIFYDMPTLNVSVENWNYYPIPLPKSKTWIQLCGHSHNAYLIGGE